MTRTSHLAAVLSIAALCTAPLALAQDQDEHKQDKDSDDARVEILQEEHNGKHKRKIVISSDEDGESNVEIFDGELFIDGQPLREMIELELEVALEELDNVMIELDLELDNMDGIGAMANEIARSSIEQAMAEVEREMAELDIKMAELNLDLSEFDADFDITIDGEAGKTIHLRSEDIANAKSIIIQDGKVIIDGEEYTPKSSDDDEGDD